MTDEIKLHHQRTRGEKAKALLANPLLQEAFAATENKIKDAWLSSDPADVELRERAYSAWLVFGDLKQFITTMINTGIVASHDLLQVEERKKAR